MPNKEMTDEDKYIYLYEQMKISESKAKTEKDRETIAANWQQTEDSFDGNTISNALQQMDERESNMSGGMAKYSKGGSMLVPPEREKHMAGALIKAGARASKKLLDEAKKHVNDLKTKPSKGQGDVSAATKGQRATRDSIRKTAAGTAIVLEGPEALEKVYDALNETEQERFKAEFSSAFTEGLDAFDFTNDEGKTYSVKVAIAAGDDSDTVYEKKMSGGMMKYNEGGSMLVPPEMQQDMPVDTYDNIPEDEMEAAEASQLPDDEMEDGYLEFVLNESLETDDQEYLMSVLETDERLSSIFDKVMDVAGEFSGEGEVDGPGTGVSDSIPARLSDGEFVFTKKATDQMGADQLQTMMDEAEKAYDGGLMKKAFGGLTNDPMADEKGYMNEDGMTREAIKEQMINANRMPSVRK
jgi:hypothetical protein